MTRSAQTAEEAIRVAGEMEEAGNLEAATAALSTAIEQDQRNPKYRALRGRLFHLRGKWAEAIRDFDSALALKPEAPTALYFRARARAMTDDLAGALQDFEHCLRLQPSSADALVEIGHIHYYQGRHLRALAAYRQAIALDPARGADVQANISEIEQITDERPRAGR